MKHTIFILAISFLLAIYSVNILWHLKEMRQGTRELKTIYRLFKNEITPSQYMFLEKVK